MATATLDQFNRLAPFYDHLAKIVFRGAIQKAHKHFIDKIPQGSRVLVLGGGTGNFLTELLKVPNVQVCFVDTSSVMLKFAKRRGENRNVKFIHGSVQSVPADLKFNVIITPFFLDLFSDRALAEEIRKINARAESEEVLWLVSDFTDDAGWKRAFLWVMYGFFRITCGLQTSALPAWHQALSDQGLIEQQVAFLYNGFIKTALYRRKTKC